MSRPHRDEQLLSALYQNAPGPRTAAMCFDVLTERGWHLDRAQLDGAETRSRYTPNKTSADRSIQVLRACYDQETLEHAALHEKRTTVLSDLLQNPNLGLYGICMIYARTNPGYTRSLNVRDFEKALDLLAIRLYAEQGFEAMVQSMMANSLPRMLTNRAVARVPGIGTDPEQVTWLVEHHPQIASLLLNGLARGCSDEVLMACARNPEMLQTEWTLSLMLRPHLAEVLYDHLIQLSTQDPEREHSPSGEFTRSAVAYKVARLPLGPERLQTLFEHYPETLVDLAYNEQFSIEALWDRPLEDDTHSRMTVASRMLKERFGDDPDAFLLAVSVIGSHTGTYRQLCDLVEAALR